jgi:hypothetical protein
MSFTWTFQGGRHRTITIGATAGNAVTNLSPGLGKRWIILRGKIICVNDATVASRQIYFNITDGTNNVYTSLLGVGGTATQTHVLNFGGIIFNVNGVAAGTTFTYFGLDPQLIEGTDQFQISVVAGVVGDSYSGYIDILEIDI